jgi:hypothetical protein
MTTTNGEFEETPAPSGLVRGVGLVMSAFGVALAMFVMWTIYRLWVFDRFDRLGAWLILGGSAIIATFCLLVGSRLFFVRPNRYGSLLTPRGWRILGSVSYSTTAAAAIAAILSGRYELLLVCPIAAGVGIISIRAASRLNARA